MGRLSKNLCYGAVAAAALTVGGLAVSACSSDDQTPEQAAAILPRSEVLSVVVTPTALDEAGNYGSAGGVVADAPAVEDDSDVPETLAFSSQPGTRLALGPSVDLGAPAIGSAGSFGAMLFAGGQVTTLRNSRAMGSTQLDYWNDTNTVVATIHHDLVTDASEGWAAAIDAQVQLLRQEFWSDAVIERFSAVGVDWSVSAPSLLILDEANNIELHLTPAELMP